MSFRIAFAAMVLLACGGDATTDDAGSDLDAAVKPDKNVAIEAAVEGAPPKVDAGYPGPHPAVPQVVNFGGSVLTAPKVIPIFFKTDPFQADVEAFLTQMAAAPYWSSVTSEYGVGALTVGTSIVVNDTPPTTTNTTQIEAWLLAYLDGTHPEFPAVALNNIYTIIYPSATTITQKGFGTSCINYGGYHDEAKTSGSAGKSVVYAVLPRCATFGTLSGLDALTGPLSHEMIEAATDPLPQTSTAWAEADQDHMVWNIQPLGEVGDMCAYEPQNYARIIGTYVAQRTWSNASAKAGHDPCVPVLAQPYYAAAPVLTEVVNLDYYGQTVATKGVQVALGKSKTIDVDLFSDAPLSNWTIQAVDATYGTSNPKELDLVFDVTSGNNGDVAHLTITRIANGQYAGSEFFVYAQRGTSYNMWFGFAAN